MPGCDVIAGRARSRPKLSQIDRLRKPTSSRECHGRAHRCRSSRSYLRDSLAKRRGRAPRDKKPSCKKVSYLIRYSQEERVTATVDIDHRPRLLATLVRALGRASAQYTAFSQALAAQLGIGATDLECLALLQDFGPASAGQLADALSLTTGAITGVVDRLEAAGFVVREADPSDRRRVIVRAVAERMQDVERAFAPLLQAAAQSLASYTQQDLDVLIDFEHRAFELMQQQTARLKAERAPSDLGPLLTAPLGDICQASLEFANGASELRIAASESATQLYQAAFEGPQPSVRVQDSSVTFRYKRMGLFDWAKHSGTVSLAATIPWSIALRGGVAN